MEKTITFEITESQMKRFEKLLDEINDTAKQTGENESGKEKQSSKYQTETLFLLARAREEIKKIKQINSKREKMIWEQ